MGLRRKHAMAHNGITVVAECICSFLLHLATAAYPRVLCKTQHRAGCVLCHCSITVWSPYNMTGLAGK